MAWSDRACIVKVGHVINIIMSPFDDSFKKICCNENEGNISYCNFVSC